MLPIIYGLTLAALGSGSPTSLERRIVIPTAHYDIVCDTEKDISWDDCQAVYDDIMSKGYGPTDLFYEWPAHLPSNALAWGLGGNCEITFQFLDDEAISKGNFLDSWYDMQQSCEPNAIGGSTTLKKGDLNGRHFAFYYDPLVNGKIPPLAKRDGLQWETQFTIVHSSPQSARQQILSGIPGGGTWSLTDSDATTNSWSSSVSIDADLFEIFTASASVSYSYSDTVTHSVTTTIDNNCDGDKTGYLYWYPEFTRYHGSYRDGDFAGGPYNVDIYVPEYASDTSGGKIGAGSYRVVCAD